MQIRSVLRDGVVTLTLAADVVLAARSAYFLAPQVRQLGVVFFNQACTRFVARAKADRTGRREP